MERKIYTMKNNLERQATLGTIHRAIRNKDKQNRSLTRKEPHTLYKRG
jgi:hypothetical protein